jgi:hypothetical protein
MTGHIEANAEPSGKIPLRPFGSASMPQNNPQSGERWRGADGTVFRIFAVFEDPYDDPDRFEVRTEPPSPPRMSHFNGRTLIHECRFVDNAPIDVGSEQGAPALDSVVDREGQLMTQLRTIMNLVEPLRIFRRLLEHPGLTVNCPDTIERELRLLGARYNVVLTHRVRTTVSYDSGVAPQVEYARIPGYATPTYQMLRIWNASPGMAAVDPENRPSGVQLDRLGLPFLHTPLQVSHISALDPGQTNLAQAVEQAAGDPEYLLIQAPHPGQAVAAAVFAREIRLEENHRVVQALDAVANQTPAQVFLDLIRIDPLRATTFESIFGASPELLVSHLGFPSNDLLAEFFRLTDQVIRRAPQSRIRPGPDITYYINTLRLTLRSYGIDPEPPPAPDPDQDGYYHFERTTNRFIAGCVQRPELGERFQRLFSQSPVDFFRGLGFHSPERFASLTLLIARALQLHVPGTLPRQQTYEYYQDSLRELIQRHQGPGDSLESLVEDSSGPSLAQVEAIYGAQPQLTPEQIDQLLTTPRHPTPEIQAFIEEVLNDAAMRVLFQRAFGQHPIDFFAPLEIENPSLLIADIRARLGGVGQPDPIPFTTHSIEGFQRLAAGLPVSTRPTDQGARPAHPERPGPFTAAFRSTFEVRLSRQEPENPTLWERLNQDDDDARR